MTVLLIYYFILFTLLALKRLEWAIYLIIFTLPTYLIRFSIGQIPFTLLEGEILILFSVWLIRKARDSEYKKITSYRLRVTDCNKYIIPTSLLLFATTISIIVSPNLSAAAGIWKAYFIEPILFLTVFLNTIKTKKQIVRIFWFLGLSIVIPGTLAIYQKFTGALIPNPFWAAEATRRVTSVYGYPNAIGLYFAPITAGAIAILIHKFHQVIKKTLPKKEKKIIWPKIITISLLTIIGLSSVYFAGSKGAMLGIGASILFYAIFWKRKRLFFTSLLVVVIAAIPLLAKERLGEVISNPSTIPGGSSFEVRLDQYKETWQMLKTRPLQGAGLAGFKDTITPYHKKDHIEIFLYPHNIFLVFWSETGLLGLLAFFWLLIIFFQYSFSLWKKDELGLRNKSKNSPPGLARGSFSESGKGGVRGGLTNNHLQFAITGAMIALLVHGLVDVPYFKNDLSMLFWALFGLILVLSNSPETKNQL